MPEDLTKFCKFYEKKEKEKHTKMVSRSRVMMSFVSCHQARIYANLQRHQSILIMTTWLASQEFNQVSVDKQNCVKWYLPPSFKNIDHFTATCRLDVRWQKSRLECFTATGVTLPVNKVSSKGLW